MLVCTHLGEGKERKKNLGSLGLSHFVVIYKSQPRKPAFTGSDKLDRSSDFVSLLCVPCVPFVVSECLIVGVSSISVLLFEDIGLARTCDPQCEVPMMWQEKGSDWF